MRHLMVPPRCRGPCNAKILYTVWSSSLHVRRLQSGSLNARAWRRLCYLKSFDSKRSPVDRKSNYIGCHTQSLRYAGDHGFLDDTCPGSRIRGCIQEVGRFGRYRISNGELASRTCRRSMPLHGPSITSQRV